MRATYTSTVKGVGVKGISDDNAGLSDGLSPISFAILENPVSDAFRVHTPVRQFEIETLLAAVNRIESEPRENCWKHLSYIGDCFPRVHKYEAAFVGKGDLNTGDSKEVSVAYE